MIARLTMLFGVLALILASVGLYGIRPTLWHSAPARLVCAWPWARIAVMYSP